MIKEEKKHSEFSASGSSRWLNCPGSVALSKTVPPLPTSPYAEEGTKAHGYCETILKGHPLPKMLPKQDKEMIIHAIKFADYVRTFMRSKKAKLGVEDKVSLEFIHEGISGTCDAWVYEPNDCSLHVFDFKYGQGILVEAFGNTQLEYYATGLFRRLIEKHDIHQIYLHIYQPRARTENGQAHDVSIHTADKIDEWTGKFTAGVMSATLDSDIFRAGDHCRYCPGKRICKEISSARMLEAKADFADVTLDLPLPQDLTHEQIGQILDRAKLVQAWVGSVEEYAYAELAGGRKIEGWKLVEKRSTRKWSNPESVEDSANKKFGIEAFDLSLKSPAQLEKIAGKEWVNERAVMISSGVTLVPESDKRVVVQLKSNAENDFDVVETPTLEGGTNGSKNRKTDRRKKSTNAKI